MKDITETQIVDSQIIRHEKAIHRYWIMDVSHIFGIRREACEQFCSHTAQLAETWQRYFYYRCSFYGNGCYSHRFDWLYGLFFLFFKRIKHRFHFSLALRFSTESNTKSCPRSKWVIPKRFQKTLCNEKVHFPSLFSDRSFNNISLWHIRCDISHVDRKHTDICCCFFFLWHFQIVMESNSVMHYYQNVVFVFPIFIGFFKRLSNRLRFLVSCMCHVLHLMACHYW